MEAETPCVEFIFQRLVQLTARAFYTLELKAIFKEDELPEATPPPKGRASKKPPADFTGLGIVVMDALLNRPWWEEEEFAKKLQLPMRPVRQVLRLLETHLLVAREHRKEKKRKGKSGEAEAEALVEGDIVDETIEDKGLLISYCSLDYQRFFDMTRFRLHRMRQALKAELEDRRAVQEYSCPICSRIYNTLHAAALIKSDGLFHCEDCNTVLDAGGVESQGGTVSRKERVKLVKAKQAQMEQELAPLTALLTEIEKKIASGDQIPDFGTLAAWASAEAERAGGSAVKRAGRRSEAAEISIKMDRGELDQVNGSEAAPRELPPWLQRQAGVSQSTQPPLASTSYSVSQEVSEDTKDFTDIKSAGPEDSKTAVEAEYMRQFKERMASIAAQGSQPYVKRQKTEGGWDEVKAEGGWQEVQPVKEDDEWEDAETAAPQAKEQQGMGMAIDQSQDKSGIEEAEEDWEDA